MAYARIAGTGSYLPSRILTNAELEKTIDTTDEWIVTRTGIRERRIAAADEVDQRPSVTSQPQGGRGCKNHGFSDRFDHRRHHHARQDIPQYRVHPANQVG